MIFEFLIGGDKQSNLSKQEWAWVNKIFIIEDIIFKQIVRSLKAVTGIFKSKL